MSLLLSIAYLRDLYRTGLAIAFVVRSVDPTLGLGYTEICRFSQVTLSSNTPHGTPLECGNLDMSHPINISILWIEERDSDQKVLLAE